MPCVPPTQQTMPCVPPTQPCTPCQAAHAKESAHALQKLPHPVSRGPTRTHSHHVPGRLRPRVDEKKTNELASVWPNSSVLSTSAYRTPTTYHVSCSVLGPMDGVQHRFLRETCVSDDNALSVFHLAPLSVRGDIAMLGIIHRTTLRKGPSHNSRRSTATLPGPAPNVPETAFN